MNYLISQIGEQQAAGFILVLARISPLFLLAPLFSSSLISGRVRTIVGLALSVGIAPIALRGRTLPLDISSLGGLLIKEIMIGLAFAFSIAVLFAAVTTAGSFLDSLVGFSYGSLVDPLNGTQGTVLAQLYSLLGVMIFIAIGGDGWAIEGITKTYQLVPITKYPKLGSLIGGTEHAFAAIFVSALELAAPVVLALVITDAGFGVVSRVVPQLNVFAVGFPAKIIVGLLVLGASLPFAAGWITNQLQQSVGSALQTLHVATVQPRRALPLGARADLASLRGRRAGAAVARGVG